MNSRQQVRAANAGNNQLSHVMLLFTWSIFANVGESISDVGGEHSSMFGERGGTGEEWMVQGLWREKTILFI